MIITVSCASMTSKDAPSTIWYWQGYQQAGADGRREIEIWARIEPPMRHEVWRDDNGNIEREIVDDGRERTLYSEGIAAPWPREGEQPPEMMIYGIQQWSPTNVDALRQDSVLVKTTKLEVIRAVIQEQFHFEIETNEESRLSMFSHHDISTDLMTIIVTDENGHIYVNGTTQGDTLVQVTVFPRKRVVWEGDDPLSLLSEMRAGGLFVSPLPPGSNK